MMNQAQAGGDTTPGLSPSIVIVRERCTHYRHAASTCSRCSSACPVGAIKLSENYPLLSPMVCTACGACAAECSMDAIALQTPTDRALAADIAVTASRCGTVTLACKQAANVSPKYLSVSCLARLDPSLLLQAPANGALEIRMFTNDCGRCPAGNMTAHLHTMKAKAEEVAMALGVSLRISVDISASDIDFSRRAWFTKLLGKGNGLEGTITVATTFRDVASDPGETAVRPTEKRRRFVASLRSLAERWEGTISNTTALFPSPELDTERCVGCALCADCCPTGALASENDAGMLRITYNTAACTACGLCVDVCYRQAIAFYPAGDIGSILAPEPRILIERRVNNDLLSSCEDKISALLGTQIYRT
ncbi:4Fe-4S dicluster domain-containing protein [Brenneria corticis]|uniref:4Fe-4S ferredoxin-type domain-containing protein n=1 Tax=Brenneria corticis TaxID=2173106 RepID=A0A2U1TNH7_9GAMM|nr:4Fe-4S dicluster domain-containing protein [Brenneria sp. CFCC 11842]PWC10964.1 hypothetical protein DDT56_20820 [Brenneria sp. CFCC 11842]